MPDSGEPLCIFVGFNTEASLYWHTLVDKAELSGRVVEVDGASKDAMSLVDARANIYYVGQLNELSNRSIRVLHTEDRQYKSDEVVLVTLSSFRTSVVWGVLLRSPHRLKVMVFCESAASASDLRCVITSEHVIQLLREAHEGKDAVKKALIFDYLRVMPMPSGDLAFLIFNVNALSEELVLRSNLESPALRVYRSLITCQHICRFSLQWGEARGDTTHFLGTLSQCDPHYVPGD